MQDLTNIRIVSDLHLEAAGFVVPPMKGDADSILVLAGDIATAYGLERDAVPFFTHVNQRFKRVFWVPGNHEYYRSDIDKADDVIRNWLFDHHFHNVTFLNKETGFQDGIAFIGATMWTNFDNENPMSMNSVQRALYDYKVIEKKGRKLLATDTLALHKEHKAFILSEVSKHNEAGLRTVVISHHAPSKQSTHPKYKGDPINAGFSNNMDDALIQAKPDVWFHGHMHDSFEYFIEKTLVACNPRGYAKGIWQEYAKLYDREEITPEEFNRYWLNENEYFDAFMQVVV